MPKRVVLAYSGGLDTSVAVRWMIDNLGVEVIALACDVGQAAEDYEEEPAPAYAPPPPSPPVADRSPADELERLAELHEQGILTDEEFAQAKAKTLGT